jgi:hypothetical protein
MLGPLRIDVGQAQCVAKLITEESETDKSRAGAPLEHLALMRYSEFMKQR